MRIDREALYARDGGLCGFCGEPVQLAEYEADHVPPLALGLPHKQMRVSHRLCNRRAGWDVRRLLHMPDQLDGYALRIRPELKTWLEVRARENRRSLNSEIVFRLEQSRDAEERRRR